jgi:hypothetical protein
VREPGHLFLSDAHGFPSPVMTFTNLRMPSGPVGWVSLAYPQGFLVNESLRPSLPVQVTVTAWFG